MRGNAMRGSEEVSLRFEATAMATGHFIPVTLSEAASGSAPRPLRVYVDGVFDMLHFGHIWCLRQIRDAFPNARIIGAGCNKIVLIDQHYSTPPNTVITDEEVHRYKGAPPVMTAEERAQSLLATSIVDEVHHGAPFYPSLELLDELEIDVISHDADPYPAPGSVDFYLPFKRVDRFLETKRTPCISTSDIIRRIIDNHLMYSARKGATGEATAIPTTTTTLIESADAAAAANNNVEGVDHY